MTVMMKCGHAANATKTLDDGTKVPACVICAGIRPGSDEVDDSPPDLTGRRSVCSYFNGDPDDPEARCTLHGGRNDFPSVAPSDPGLPFFTHQPDKPYDSHYSGCWGWD